jgi:Cu-processing system permease protein
VFDLLLLGGLVATGGKGVSTNVFPYLLLLDPADVFRILNVLSAEGVKVQFGLATVFPPALAKPWLLGSVMTGWIVAPLGLALWRFK